MEGWHWATLLIVALAAYYVGRKYPLGLPGIG